MTEIREVITQTTATNATMKGDLIVKSVPRQVMVEVLEESKTDENTIEEYTCDILDKNETTKRKVSTELLDMSQKCITQGFLELAEEAKLVGIGKTASVLMNEVLPEITEITRPTSDSISWKIEEDIEQSVESLCEVIMEVTTVRFDVGQLMRWPDMNSDGVMICEFMLESEMFSHGPVRREAEPVFVTAESEMFTPVFAGGVVAESDPLVVAEAVTSRVSVLPTVGSEFQTGLSAAVGGEDRWCLSSGDVLDKVGHVAGRSDARMVPVEHLLFFSRVRNVMLSWLRLAVALTSQFFLSGEGEDVEVPLYINDDRPVQRTKVYFDDVEKGPQMTEGTHGVGPTGDRWDGQRILDMWYKLCKWMDTQLWDPGTSLRLTNGPDTVGLGTVARLVLCPAEKLLLGGALVPDVWEMKPVRLAGTDSTNLMLIGWTDIRTGGAVRL